MIQRVLMILLIMFPFKCSALAQFFSSPFTKGQIDISPGIGLLNVMDVSFHTGEYGTKTKVPPISLSIDGAVSDKISIGGCIGYGKTAIYGPFSDIGTVSHVFIAARVQYHFMMSEKFDTYAGGLLGYNAQTVDVPNYSITGKSYVYSLMLGARYRFSGNTGFFAEIGYGISVLNVGLNFRCPAKGNKSVKK